MFDRRARIFLLALVVMTLVLLARAVQVQVLERTHWNEEADKVMSTGELIETSRGRLLDRKGRVLAEDTPCIDACVDYRAISQVPDDAWAETIARSRVRNRVGMDEYRQLQKSQREPLVKAEKDAVESDIRDMWRTLAQLGQMPIDQMDELRQAIVHRVEMRRRQVWFKKYQDAIKDHANRDAPPWYQSWLMDESQQVPEVEDFNIQVAEQTQAHVILSGIDNVTNNFLAKHVENLPGLVLRPGLHRRYPNNDVAAQLIGHLGHVSQADLPTNGTKVDELHDYLQNDLIGRSGLEALCEPLLRGTRGKIESYAGDPPREFSHIDPIPGQDVRTTIDIDLQADVQQLFTKIPFLANKNTPTDTIPMPGAAVILDVKTNQVLAMVSYPSYDANSFEELYSILANNDIDQPLLNRATQVAFEPGSTVKPMVGLGAITQGAFPLDGTVECIGYLQLNGRVYKTAGRCWTMSMWGRGHHEVPTDYPHLTGFLTYSDALERSCNVFFETLADKLGREGLNRWFTAFGLGRPTGLGIAEVRGRVPLDMKVSSSLERYATWFSGIGQSQVLATPIQMADVAATIARNGIWMRPRLVPEDIPTTMPKVYDRPDREDLHLSPGALVMAREGMKAVVASPAGTGQLYRTDKLVVAGKTGSAQAAPLKVYKRDSEGNIIYSTTRPAGIDENGQVVVTEKKRPELEQLPLGTHAHPNPPNRAPWYRGTGDEENHISHAWYIGFAPADDPKIAFAVLVEYGGGGGASAGFVANGLLDACIDHGYLERK